MVITIFTANFFLLLSYSQNTSADYKNRLMLNLGSEYRVTPIYTFNNPTAEAAFTNIDKQNSGMAITVGLEYFVTNNFSVGFNNFFKYGLVISERPESSEGTVAKSSDFKLLFDYEINVAY